jgi:hypothetical protein
VSARRRRAVLGVVLIVWVVHTACGGGLLFSQDRRVEIVSPKRNAKVTLPLTVRWSVDGDVQIGRDIAQFAVLFDTEPPPPSKTLAHLVRGDLDCKRTPGCPDAAYFADRDIYVTQDTSITIDELLPLAGVRVEKGERDGHDVTVIVLDEQGRRTSEAFWSQTFEILHPEIPE